MAGVPQPDCTTAGVPPGVNADRASFGPTRWLALRGRRIAVSMILSLAALLVLAAASALAAQTHPFLGSFGSFGNPNGIAVDSSGDVYVADIATDTVQKFDASGNPVSFSSLGSNSLTGSATPEGSFSFSNPAALAIDNSGGPSAGDLYVLDANHNVVDKFGPGGGYLGQVTGTPAGPFSQVEGMGVDGAGDLDVYEGNVRVDQFDGSASNAFLQSFPYSYGSSAGFAVDPGGAYYTMSGCGCVEKWDRSGADLGQVDRNSSGVAIAVDPATNHAYVDDGAFVAEWDTSAMPGGAATNASNFGSAQLSNAGGGGVAVNGSTGDIYVADPATGEVFRYGPAATIPDVSTGQASNVTGTSATLGGTVNPDGTTVTDCHFDYVDAAHYNASSANPYAGGGTAACSPNPSGSSPVAVSANVTGLSVGTTYHFRLEASNSSGTNLGVDGTLQTASPPAVDGQSTANVTRAGATLQAQINPDGLATTYHFEYGSASCSANPCTSVPVPDADIGAGASDQAVSQGIAGLQVNATYHYRVVATNSLGATDGPDQTFTTEPIVAILGAGAVNVSASSAELESAIDVFGAATSYQFEYGTSTAYGSTIPVPDGQLGNGADPQTATANLGGLAPGTTYHLRLTATNSFGTVIGPDVTFTTTSGAPCPNAQFRTGPSASLSDCRAYEQVTPADKSGSTDPDPRLGLASDDGNRVYLSTYLANFGPHPANMSNSYAFARSPLGWVTTNAYPANGGDAIYWAQLFSPDLSQLALAAGTANQLGFSGAGSLVAGPVGGPYARVTGQEPISLSSPSATQFVGASADFSHLLLTSTDKALAPAASGQVAGSQALYDWTDGQLQLVNVNTDGSLTSPCGAALAGPEPGVGGSPSAEGEAHNAVSNDGSKVFFISPDPWASATDPSCSQPQQLYLGNTVTGTTVAVSCPSHVPDPSGCQAADYVGASADGARVFFATTTELTQDALGTGNDRELYEYDTNTGTLTRVTHGTSGTSAADDFRWALVSEDGSTVYFVADGQLAPGAPADAQPKIYRYDVVTGATTFVASDPADDLCGCSAPLGYDTARQFYTTPDGRFLLFASTADLTPYQSEGTPELYRYSVADGSLICVSCNPSGAPPQGAAQFTGTLPSTSDQRLPRPMSDDGAYVFFDTSDPLVPQANDTTNVYEWHAGQISLISSGTDPQPSLFIDSSADGQDVFFTTHSQLVPQDGDLLSDIYDARIGGGFPAPSVSDCSGDGCQGALSPPPAAPAIVTFSAGPGNQATGATPGASLTVLHRSAKGNAFRLTVKVSGGGLITISGAGVDHVARPVAHAGTYLLTVSLTRKAKRQLQDRRRLKVTLTVAFTGSGGSRSAAFSITARARRR